MEEGAVGVGIALAALALREGSCGGVSVVMSVVLCQVILLQLVQVEVASVLVVVESGCLEV